MHPFIFVQIHNIKAYVCVYIWFLSWKLIYIYIRSQTNLADLVEKALQTCYASSALLITNYRSGFDIFDVYVILWLCSKATCQLISHTLFADLMSLPQARRVLPAKSPRAFHPLLLFLGNSRCADSLSWCVNCSLNSPGWTRTFVQVMFQNIQRNIK